MSIVGSRRRILARTIHDLLVNSVVLNYEGPLTREQIEEIVPHIIISLDKEYHIHQSTFHEEDFLLWISLAAEDNINYRSNNDKNKD